ncbi:MAG: hypothetical protein ABID38_00710 [Candidatus Diapherotrites archaeon]
MPRRKQRENVAQGREIIRFLKKLRKKSPAQREKLKVFLRTGEVPKGLSINTIVDFSWRGLDYKEHENMRGRNPYLAKFSPVEEKEIKRQIRDAVTLLCPGESVEQRKNLISRLERRIVPIGRRHVEEEIGNGKPERIFDFGRMYLDAIDGRNRVKAKKRSQRSEVIGESGTEVVLGRRWHNSKFDSVTPFHELAHSLIDATEYESYLIEFYYALKRGIYKPEYLKKITGLDEETKGARKRAIELYQQGLKNGWRASNQRLRKILELYPISPGERIYSFLPR